MARALLHAPTIARRGDVFLLRALVAHPMDSGHRVDAMGRLLPRNIVRRMECHYDGERVFAADLHAAIAANPGISFYTVATRSGAIRVRWWGDQGFEAETSVHIEVT